MVRRFLRAAATIVGPIIFVAQVLHGQNTGVQYVYDELGRLVAVVDPSGNSAVYSYDAVGNLLSIARHGPTDVSVFEVTPDSGAVGSTVAISGSGFSTTPGQNTVQFNGTAAPVASASANSLVVAVPSGATGGPISVTSPFGSAASSTPFTVIASGAPTITGFTPAAGVPGTFVEVEGTSFDSAPANNNARFNSALAEVTAASGSLLMARVPEDRGSGRISVTTPGGTAVSAGDFIIPPPPYTPTDVAAAGRMAFDMATTVTVSPANRIALQLFDGSPGQRVSLRGTSGTIQGQIAGCDVYVSILNPDVSVAAAPACMEGNGFIDVTPLSMAGTYTILIDPVSTSSGSLTLTLYELPADFSGSIAPGGAPVVVPITTPGQNGRLTFSGTSGQRISLRGTNGTIFGQVLGCDVNVSLLNPDGTTLVPGTCMEGSGFINTMALNATGTYTIVVNPVSTATGNLTLALYDVVDFSGSITAGGPAVTVPITAPGQNGTLTFGGTAGQRISLQGTNGTMTGQLGCDVSVSILNPDGTTLVPNTCMEGRGFVNTTTLGATGTYTIFVNPAGAATGNLTLTLFDVVDVTGVMTAGGAPVTVAIAAPGQNGTLTFSGAAGQRVSLQGTNGTISAQPLACDVNVSILNPDTSVLAPAACMEGSGFVDVKTLATTGTYTIVVDPAGTATGSLTLTLSDVPADPTATVTINGAPATLTSDTPGQNAQATFSGTSGQQVTVRLTGSSIGSTTVALLKPDGGQLTSATSSASSFNLSAQMLPATGTYTIAIDPSGPNTGTTTISVTEP